MVVGFTLGHLVEESPTVRRVQVWIGGRETHACHDVRPMHYTTTVLREFGLRATIWWDIDVVIDVVMSIPNFNRYHLT